MIKNRKIIPTLCKGCGLCVALCSQSAISMRRDEIGLYVPQIDQAACMDCGLCAKTCPAASEYRKHIVADSDISQTLLGPFKKVFVGRATDPDILKNATAGGIVTALLTSAMNNKIIDSCLEVKADESDPFKSQAVIITNIEDVRGVAGSRYLPVELSPAIKKLCVDVTLKRTAIVGLPCQLAGVNLAKTLVTELEQKIAFTIGLFCKQTKDLRFTDLILRTMKLSKEQVRNIKYRSNGWPGDVTVVLKNGEVKTRPCGAFNALWGTLSCSPAFCLTCTNPLAETADIAIGDAWLPRYITSKKRSSLIVIRTQRGMDIVNRAVVDQVVELEEINPEEVLDTQPKFIIAAKKNNYQARLKVLRFFYKDVHSLATDYATTINRGSRLEAWWVYLVRVISSSALFRHVYRYFPKWLLQIMSGFCLRAWRTIYSRTKPNIDI